MLPVIEKFVSIDGEGPMAGALAVFIRFQGCNLRCKWCDTQYSWEKELQTEFLTAKEIFDYIKSTGVKHITLTGGEPLLQAEIGKLLEILIKEPDYLIHIETNGAVDITPFKVDYSSEKIRYIVDYKLPDSGMESKMNLENLNKVEKQDAYKFVIASERDLERAYKVIMSYGLMEKCQVYLSPVTDCIKPERLVEFMKEKNLGGLKLQLQLHKMIWDKESRGV